MPKFIIPTDEIYKIVTPNPYVIAREFGLTSLRGLVYGQAVPKNIGVNGSDRDSPYSSISSSVDVEDVPSEYKSGVSQFFGTPVYNGLQFEGGQYKDNSGKSITYPSIELETVLFDVAMTRNIVKTVVQGRQGTIKEYISDGDFDVNIKGVICDQVSNYYPEGEVSQLFQMLQAMSSVKVKSAFLNQIFGIYNLVVESYSFEMVAGYQNMQRFTMKCISDEPLEFKLSRR